nr:rod-binding protein [Bacteriovorax sp. HI3]
MSDTKINPQINRGISVNDQVKPKELNQGRTIDDRQYIPKQFKDVAASMEQQFAEMMVEQMAKTVDEADSEGGGGMAMDYYKSLQKGERAKALTEQNNLGLQDMILNQIYPKRMRNEVALRQYEAQANRIHQNLPSYKIDRKTDTIEMGKNDSTPVTDEKALSDTKESGGLQ